MCKPSCSRIRDAPIVVSFLSLEPWTRITRKVMNLFKGIKNRRTSLDKNENFPCHFIGLLMRENVHQYECDPPYLHVVRCKSVTQE